MEDHGFIRILWSINTPVSTVDLGGALSVHTRCYYWVEVGFTGSSVLGHICVLDWPWLLYSQFKTENNMFHIGPWAQTAQSEKSVSARAGHKTPACAAGQANPLSKHQNTHTQSVLRPRCHFLFHHERQRRNPEKQLSIITACPDLPATSVLTLTTTSIRNTLQSKAEEKPHYVEWRVMNVQASWKDWMKCIWVSVSANFPSCSYQYVGQQAILTQGDSRCMIAIWCW